MSSSPDLRNAQEAAPGDSGTLAARLLRRLGMLVLAGMGPAAAAGEIDRHLDRALAAEPERRHAVLVRIRGEAPAIPASALAAGDERTAQAVERLQAHASGSQRALRQWLADRRVAHRPFWLGNMIRLDADRNLVETLAQRGDVGAILLDRTWRQVLPAPYTPEETAGAGRAIEPGITHIGVPAVWAAGVTGQGVVVAGQDTGYQWNHPALQARYRGWDGAKADHDYNWHDAIHELIGGGVNSCGIGLQAPCDDNNHGTHTMGTMVGDDGGANQIGIAPGARWIGCRNMEEGDGRPSTYTECFQWFMAPTALDGSGANPELAPHVINNSWGCPLSEGCTEKEIDLMRDVVDAVHAAGIMVVVSAGNSGSACASVSTPAAIYASSFTVGASGAGNDNIASFSSRGPTPDGLLKPDVTAPGVGIRSSINGGYGSSSGTSMAGPHVAGVAALLMSVNPSLRRDPEAVADILRGTAVPRTSAQNCGAFPGDAVPNAVFGHGRIDAWAAFRVAETIFVHDFE